MNVTYTLDASQPGKPNNRCYQAAGCDYLFPHTESNLGQELLDRMTEKRALRYLRCHSPLGGGAYATLIFCLNLSP